MREYPEPVQAFEALMSDLRLDPKARACVAIPTRTMACNTFDAFVKKFESELARVSRLSLQAQLPNGAKITFKPLNHPRGLEGHIFTHVVRVLSPQLADTIKSLDLLAHAMRRAGSSTVYEAVTCLDDCDGFNARPS